MADKPRGLDVQIVETATIYPNVPYAVVTDWIQQGRLLTEDKVRAAGTQDWKTIGEVRTLAAFLPKAEPFRAEDKAEALEPVEVGFHVKPRRAGAEDDDVDMIPLIDISLVLLIFFMMTAAVETGILSPIETPPARHQLAAIAEDMYWVGVDVERDGAGEAQKDAGGQPLLRYSVGKGAKDLDSPSAEKQDSRPLMVTPAKAAARLAEELAPLAGTEVRVRLRANKELPVEVVRELTVALQEMEGRLNSKREPANRLKLVTLGEVSEPPSK